MAVADNNPERRNLNISSLCIIIYYLAEGSFVDSKIKLPMVNISFSNPQMLCFIFWALLFWFALRYWQTHKGLIDKTYLEEIKIRKSSSAAISYIESRTGTKHRKAGGFVPRDISRSSGRLCIQIGDVQGGNLDPDGTLVNFRTGNFELVPINGIRGRIFHLISFVSLAFLKPGFGNFVVPYVLFSFACILGLVNSVL
jgi:hypothetical protein